MYFDGWNGLGVVPVLRSIAAELLSTKAHPSEPCFDKILYLDCSEWESRRMMQRKIAEELKLDHTTMKVFDTRDEDEDFYGEYYSSRDMIQSVAALIFEALKDRRFMMIFINGSDDEIDVTRFGILMATYLNNRLIWTFNRRLLTIHHMKHDEIRPKLRDTPIFIYDMLGRLSFSEFQALLHEEATSIIARHPCMQGIDPIMVKDCYLYALFFHYNFRSTTGFDWMAHASNYWMCISMTKGDTKSEIVNALQKEIRWKCYGPLLEELCERFMIDLTAPFLVVKDHMKNYQRRPYHWICITLGYLTIPKEDLVTILERASSLFVVSERSNDPPRLPNGLFKHCSNLTVLNLCFCTFNFDSPPFLGCQTIKFLGLEHCRDNKTSKGNNPTNWAHLQGVLVLDIRNTDWDDILSKEKLKIMDNLIVLNNIKGSKCWQYINHLQNRLPHLEKLRITKPIKEAVVAPIDIKHSSHMDKKMLQILDLSSNKDMKNLLISIISASNLEVLVLDGCDELENVVLSNEFPGSSLRSFSFDGYGPTTQWKSMVDLPPESSRPKHLSDKNNRDIIKTSKISLQGCKQLENLFLRGLPNLVE
ncbi:hypothetical protein PR202_gb21966 [Eleusine coracana subsp. coracana]|uniref:Uncharacterized protein n=1 Tax=Eleusine coracana subsp. coracana TaxID=191504 RepID=A0AAV5FEJ9_ELECO|nr:hypothetical protein PR202_gb21966 [Eleusine coracana subsp. coracana]